jgi:hypothetical protein
MREAWLSRVGESASQSDERRNSPGLEPIIFLKAGERRQSWRAVANGVRAEVALADRLLAPRS